jgi:lambda repressor-like predicted transcriptional regulator
MVPIRAQLHAAWKASGIPIRIISDKTDIDRSTVHKVLSGAYAMTTIQAEKIAKVLKCTIVWAPRVRRTAAPRAGARA